MGAGGSATHYLAVLGLGSLLIGVPASAALQVVDLDSPGDGLITRDTATGLEWLDVSETSGLSYNEVEAGADGWLASGWRHATGAQVCDLFARHALAPAPCPSTTGASAAADQTSTLIGLLGSTAGTGGPPCVGCVQWTVGLYEDADGASSGSVGQALLGFEQASATPSTAEVTDNAVETSELPPAPGTPDLSNRGHFLVRVSALVGAAPFVYVYRSMNFNQIWDSTPPAGTYTTDMAIQVAFTLAEELPPDFSGDVVQDVLGFAFADGRQIISHTDDPYEVSLYVETDANADIVTWSVGTFLTSGYPAHQIVANGCAPPLSCGANWALIEPSVGLTDEALAEPGSWSLLVPRCSDGADNDGDGLIDYPADPGCAKAGSDVENPECDDELDNDGDGAVDSPDDPGCFSAAAHDEDPVCDDGVDNDGDSLTDYPEDFGCAAAWALSESACGLGPELVLVLPPLMWLRWRRKRV